MMRDMGTVVHLVDRPTYGFKQIDSLLGLPGGTSGRWIDGYTRQGKWYEPVVRESSTGNPIATWGEFIETRLLAEYRHAGVPMVHMRPAVEALREELKVQYPLASARTWIHPEGRELVRVVQDRVKLDKQLSIVVMSTGQLVAWSEQAERFRQAIDWGDKAEGEEPQRLRPAPGIFEVVVDPLRGFGDPVVSTPRGSGKPVVHNVRTEIIRELFEAGESEDAIAEVYELPRKSVEAAVRYELRRAA